MTSSYVFSHFHKVKYLTFFLIKLVYKSDSIFNCIKCQICDGLICTKTQDSPVFYQLNSTVFGLSPMGRCKNIIIQHGCLGREHVKNELFNYSRKIFLRG